MTKIRECIICHTSEYQTKFGYSSLRRGMCNLCYQKWYYHTPSGKAVIKLARQSYLKSEKGRRTTEQYLRKYNLLPRVRAYRKAYSLRWSAKQQIIRAEKRTKRVCPICNKQLGEITQVRRWLKMHPNCAVLSHRRIALRYARRVAVKNNLVALRSRMKLLCYICRKPLGEDAKVQYKRHLDCARKQPHRRKPVSRT